MTRQFAPAAPPRQQRGAITVIIPTRDEALHIARCVDSARPLGRVVVVDAGSGDGTQELARAHGADVVEHAWEGYAAQKNWALDHLAIETEWVLFLDADETLSDALVDEIEGAIASREVDGYWLARRYVFLGRELRHAWWYPDYQLRLFRRANGKFEDRSVHEHVLLEGAVARLKNAIVHENLKGLAAFVDRHNRYSSLEAERLRKGGGAGREKAGALLGGWADRRRALKDRLWFRVPLRPIVRFCWHYFVKLGFLDGRRGFLFCALMAMYDFLIDAKLMEPRLTAAAEPPSPAINSTEAASR